MSKRGLLILLAITALVAIAALWGLRGQSPDAGAGAGKKLFPDLAGQLEQAREVSFKAAGDTVTLRQDEQGWKVVERDYPADRGKVRQLLLELTAVTAVEPKTQDPAKYHYLGVQAPEAEGSQGVLLSVRGEQGPLAELIVGKDAGSQGGLFVRRPDEAQSWLARGLSAPQLDVSWWLERSLLSVPAGEVRQIDLKPAKAAALSLVKDSPETEHFSLRAPAGRKLSDQAAADALAGSLADVRVLDVRPVGPEMDEATSRLEVRTFDGRVIVAEFAHNAEGEYLSRWQMSLDEAAAERAHAQNAQALAALREQVKAFAARVEGKVFELAAPVVKPWETTLDRLSQK